MVPVTIYTRQGCGYCVRAKSLLSEKGVDFVEHDATYAPEIRQEMINKSNGRSTFPQIFIGQDHVGGCDDLHALDRAGKLDPMLAA
ncbi:glutaredoxin 3 [Rhizobium sp. AC44/96]|jgi:glutaredoxin 3|uniref:glutaredoxin 3 n=1 Tax=unclassified Rhizobium TaxID=2613769 RepID=UPI00080FA71C|nr:MULTISPECIES: glutaredoxin 3 [unclassified Rhizobium]MDM9621561.1 glutaredoxin 3 [Rhizobium sp. S96]OCJ11167.1 glutaredoxin 3 [Rhizobium sp. AC44/96]